MPQLGDGGQENAEFPRTQYQYTGEGKVGWYLDPRTQCWYLGDRIEQYQSLEHNPGRRGAVLVP